MKSKSAITLVALIITIIVLLILATVSISLVINNGILEKAQNGVDKYSEEEELEQIKLAVASAKLAENGFLDTKNLNSELRDKFGEGKEAIENSNGWSFKLDKNYTIYEDGKVEENLLPVEYQQIKYIESTGTQYIDTGYYSNGNSSFVFEYSDNKVNGVMFGAYNIDWYSGYGAYINATKDGNNPFLHYFSNTRIPIGYYPEGKIKIENGNYYLNDTEYINLDTKQFNLNYTTYIFAGNWRLSRVEQPTQYKLYFFKIYDSNKLILDFIPCYSTTNVTNAEGIQVPANTKGLYDLVEGKFYTNKNSTGDDFIAGPEV